MTTAPVTAPGFAAALRAATAEAHERAESTRFVADLMEGRLEVDAYAGLLGQLRHVYAALESVGDGLATDPVAGPFVDEDLRRLAHLERDLTDLVGGDWPAAATPRPATARYVARLREVADWPGGFVAHHYTRYLGDLAGGQAIRAAVRRHYGLEGDVGTRFFVFDRIEKPKVWRDAYRARLDALPLDADERTRVAAEAVHAFELNTELFLDLERDFRPHPI
ncbi:biliverdin-producing heme oxygenase [Nitriliruptoraceae bacterium ZYF776]|nr:biliverdin-producing heme oxygenase [Profundirhabdus halotolerans]